VAPPTSTGLENERFAGAALTKDREQVDVENFREQVGGKCEEAVEVCAQQRRLREAGNHALRDRPIWLISSQLGRSQSCSLDF
jgi:hypothetical protein